MSNMSLRKRENYVFYPEYFDKHLSRAYGRRVPKKLAVESPTLEMIVIAAKRLGLEPVVEKASYPRRWWENRGRIIIPKKDHPKTKVLKTLAKSLLDVHEYVRKKQEREKEKGKKKVKYSH